MREPEPFDPAKQSLRFRVLRRVAIVVIGAAMAFGAIVALSLWKRQVQNLHSSNCINHLHTMGGSLARIRSNGTRLPPLRDVRDYLALYRDGTVTVHSPAVFICEGDDAVVGFDEAKASYPTADLSSATFIASHFSYAVRDLRRFPIAEGDDKAILMCDRQGLDGRTPHHANGLCVVRADGSARYMGRKQLGLGQGEPIVVGPDSQHPELKKMIFLHAD